jgi:excisionase family DNA binding protein
MKTDFTPDKARKYLKPPVSRWRIYGMIKQGKFPNAYKPGRDWLIPKKDLDAENERREKLNARDS